MLLNTALSVFAAAISVGAVVAAHDAATAAYEAAGGVIRSIESVRDAEHLKAAQIGYMHAHGPSPASEAELVRAGFLSEDWLTRPSAAERLVVLPAGAELEAALVLDAAAAD